MVCSLLFHFTLLGKPKDNIIFDDKQFFFYNPLKSHPKHLRVIPVKKRLVKEFITRDKKNVEVVVVLRSQPKIAYAIDIYRAFGNDYSRGFLEKEVSFDIQEVLKDYNYEQLVNTESVSDEIIRDLEVRVNEAAAFHHLTISDMVSYFCIQTSFLDICF